MPLSPTTDEGGAARVAVIWLAYLSLGGNLTRVQLERRLHDPAGLGERDRLILDQVLFEERLARHDGASPVAGEGREQSGLLKVGRARIT